MSIETIRDELFDFESADVAGYSEDLKLKIPHEETTKRELNHILFAGGR